MIRYAVSNPISPDTRFGDVKSGQLFQRFNGGDVWIKLSAAFAQRIDNHEERARIDESEVVRRAIVERQE